MKTLSLAVLLLLGDAAATELYRKSHGKSYVQFLEGDFDDLNQDFIAEQQTKESVQEAEKQMGKQVKVDAETMNASLDRYTKMNFDQDGETFSKATSVADNVMLQYPTYYNPYPGITLIQSDPIHGSLGEPKIKLKDLTPEQQFEETQRRKVPVVFKDDKVEVTDTDESIKWAEENTGGKMPEPVEKKKMKKPVKYTLHDSDDEEDDTGDSTVETRKSVKWGEKSLKKRFFINAKEKRDYEAAMADGKISEKQLDFKEDEDEELGPVDPEQKFKQATKKKAKLEELAKKKAEKNAPKKSAKEKKEEEEAAEKEAEIAKAKEERPDNQEPKPLEIPPPPKHETPPHPPIPSDLPPELAGALTEGAPPSDLPPELAGALAQNRRRALVQQRHRVYQDDSDSDSSSDSDDE